MDSVYLERFDEALKAWDDERFVSRQQIRTLAMFFLYLVNLADDDGWQYDGHSLKVRETTCILTVKATLEGTPHVVFSSGRDAMGCVQAFMRKLEEGWLEWVVDRYR